MRSSRSGGARTFDVERSDGRAAGMHDAASSNTVRRSVLAVGGSYGSLPQVVGLSPDWVHEERHVGHFCNFGSSHAGGARGPVLTDASVAQPTARRADGALRKTEIMFYCAHPASLGRGVARDRHDTRGGERWPWFCRSVSLGCADERLGVDVKSQRADTPMLVSSAMCESALSPWWPTRRRTRQTAYKR